MSTDDLGPCVDEEIRFVWVDEDGQPMSPRHEKFRSALNFINGWSARWDRVRHLGKDSHWVLSVTKTGKPPVKLQRLVVRAYAVDLTPGQQEIVDTYLEDIDATQ
jgi:hypothetical protein